MAGNPELETFNQRVVGSIPTALTKSKQIPSSDYDSKRFEEKAACGPLADPRDKAQISARIEGLSGRFLGKLLNCLA